MFSIGTYVFHSSIWIRNTLFYKKRKVKINMWHIKKYAMELGQYTVLEVIAIKMAITSRYYLLALSLGRYNVYNVPKQPKKAIMKVAACRYRLGFKNLLIFTRWYNNRITNHIKCRYRML